MQVEAIHPDYKVRKASASGRGFALHPGFAFSCCRLYPASGTVASGCAPGKLAVRALLNEDLAGGYLGIRNPTIRSRILRAFGPSLCGLSLLVTRHAYWASLFYCGGLGHSSNVLNYSAELCTAVFWNARAHNLYLLLQKSCSKTILP